MAVAYPVPIYLPRRRRIISPGEWLRDKIAERGRERDRAILLAGTVHEDGRAVTTNASTYASNSFTPAANDLLIVFAQVTNHSAYDTPSLTSSVGGQTFTLIGRALYASSVHTLSAFVSDQLMTATAQTVTYQAAADNGTGAITWVVAVSGMSRTGASAIRQSAKQENQAASGTPAPVFGATTLLGNPLIGCIANNTNPAGMTPPTGFTELTTDLGYATPTSGGEYCSKDGGDTITTVTWGSTSASTFASMALELDASAAGATADPYPYVGAGYYPTQG